MTTKSSKQLLKNFCPNYLESVVALDLLTTQFLMQYPILPPSMHETMKGSTNTNPTKLNTVALFIQMRLDLQTYSEIS